MLRNIFFVLLLAVMTIACTKEQPVPEFEINLLQPLDGQVFEQDDTVHVRANIIVRTGELHGYELYVYDSNSLAVLLTNAKHAHSNELTIDTFFVNKVTTATATQLELRTYLSHSTQPVLNSRTLSLMP
jgi:hypothetical protein